MRKLINFLISNLVILSYFVKLRIMKQAFDDDFILLVISKDRPFSLRSFLRSVREFFPSAPQIKVVICCRDNFTKLRYEKVKREFDDYLDVEYIYEEACFKSAMIDCLDSTNVSRVMLCVDDQVLFRNVEYSELVSSLTEVDFFTLRLDLKCDYSYNLNENMSPPSAVEKHVFHNSWRCKNIKNDFYYALSFDTTLIPTTLLKSMCYKLYYTSPNQLESYMNYSIHSMTFCRMRIGCRHAQSAINFVLNKVQQDNDNRSLQLSLEELNNLFDIGKCVTADKDYIENFRSSHSDYGYKFKDFEC